MMKVSKLLGMFLMLLVAPQPATPRNRPELHSCFQAPGPEWQRYKVNGEEFSVSLPFNPAMSTVSVSYSRNKTRRERKLTAYADGVVFAIGTFEKKGISLDELVGKISSCAITKPVIVDGVAGKSCNFEEENSTWIRKVFATDRNLYTFVAVASKLGDHSAAISSFFTSIRFRESPEGSAVFDGPGEQPLSHENGAQADSIFRSKEMTVRARVISKPEPQYTELARQKQTTGTVVLRAIFSMSGAVENIQVLREMPNGLTEKAIAAARQIRFIPATKDGRFVSMWIQLEYNFNLY